MAPNGSVTFSPFLGPSPICVRPEGVAVMFNNHGVARETCRAWLCTLLQAALVELSRL